MNSKLYLFFLASIVGNKLFAQEYATFKCTINNPLRDWVVVEKMIQPVAKRDTVKLDAKNSFSFKTDDIDESQAYRVYYGDTKKQSEAMQGGSGGGMTIMSATWVDKFELLLMPGYNLTISVDATNRDKTLKITGKGSEVSNYFQKKDALDIAMTMTYPSKIRSPKDSFLVFIDTYYKEKTALINKSLPLLKYLPKNYIAEEKKNLNYNVAQRKTNFAVAHINRFKNDSSIKVFDNKYFSYLKDVPFNKDEDKDHRYYTLFVRTYVNYLLAKNNKGAKLTDEEMFRQKYEIYKTLFKSDVLRDFQMFDMLYQFNSRARESWYDAAAKDYYSRSKNDSLKAELENILQIRRHMGKGLPAYNFTVFDRYGQKHSLTDYKGKHVLIDVWATWCKPCVYEIPYLQKLEKDFAGKPIEFLSISIDDDSTRWRKFLDKKEMHGNQLWNGKDKSQGFGKEFLIQGIPRFILIDPEGNFLDPNAPRPSAPDLGAILRSIKELKGPSRQQTPAEGGDGSN